jgi:Ser/Thr protein kinase RdoA (MazF antagonist)
MQTHDQLPTKEDLFPLLEKLFGFSSIQDLVLIVGGHLSKNFLLLVGGEKYFLKQYRYKLNPVIHQIKFAETFYSSKGVRVIMPLRDRFDRPAFFFNGNWFSLFPFIDKKAIEISQLTDDGLMTLANQLGVMHTAGKDAGKTTQSLLMWDKNRFNLDVCELEMKLESTDVQETTNMLIASVLEQKKKFVEKNIFALEDISLPFDTLLHGDLSYQNVFFSPDQKQIDYVFDFEKTARGPRAFELARSICINVFDDGWDDKRLEKATLFLRAYQEVAPITYEEFLIGLRAYLVLTAHQLWIEWKILFCGETKYIPLLRSHSIRINHLGDGIDTLATSIYGRQIGSHEFPPPSPLPPVSPL